MNTPYNNAQNAYKAYNNSQVKKAYENVPNTQAQKIYSNVSNVQAQKAYGNVPNVQAQKVNNNTSKVQKDNSTSIQNNSQVKKVYQQSINTMPPEQLTYMLYNGAIKFCNLGIEGIEKNDIVVAHQNIIKVENIILELIGSLDEKYDIAKEYKRLYYYIYDCLVEANVHKDIKKLEEAKEFIIWFRDLWKEVITENKKNKQISRRK